MFIDDRYSEMSLERHGGIVGGLENVHIFYSSRYPNLMAKYTAGIEFAAAKGIEWDAVCVMTMIAICLSTWSNTLAYSTCSG